MEYYENEGLLGKEVRRGKILKLLRNNLIFQLSIYNRNLLSAVL